MPGPDLSLFAPLREAYAASRAVRTRADLDAVLERVAALVNERLGWGTVVVNVHRRAWDDFLVTTVHGDAAARATLLGSVQTWTQWAPLFGERYQRRGAHFVPHEDADRMTAGLTVHDPRLPIPVDPGGWHPHDMLLVLMRGNDGEVTGILSVDEPASGRRPTDDELDALVAVANIAGAALHQARESATDAQHRAALEHLLSVSTQIAEARSRAVVLEAVCAGIRDALGFERVTIQLADDDGTLSSAAHVGWDDLPAVPIAFDRLSRLFVPEHGAHGSYILERGDALEMLGLPDSPYRSSLNGRGPWAWDGHWLMVPLRDQAGRLIGFIWPDEPRDRLLPDTPRLQALRLFADQAQAALESARHYEQTLHLAQHDALTGLPNRGLLLDKLGAALRGERRRDHGVAVLFVDLDGFKAVNDTHGHDVGDVVLQVLAARIDESLRPGDTVGRMGGDEFVVVCEDVRDERDALELARRVADRLADPIHVGDHVVELTASVGAALADGPDETANALLRNADEAMYRVKQAHRGAPAVG